MCLFCVGIYRVGYSNFVSVAKSHVLPAKILTVLGSVFGYFCEDDRHLQPTRHSRIRFVAFTYLEFGQIDWQNAGFLSQKSP